MSNYLENKEKRKELTRELASVINRHSLENGSDTPDWILADYLLSSLEAFNLTTKSRERWYGREPKPSSIQLDPPNREPSLEQLAPNARIYRFV